MMPGRNIEFGKYGARVLKRREAVARQLDALAAATSPPITARRGLQARLRYFTRTDHACNAACQAGLTVTDRNLRSWQVGTRTPSKKNLDRIEQAYRTVRRETIARYLAARLNREGRGTAGQSARSTSPRPTGPASAPWSSA
ncbi:hypothetical protein [Streptomyces phaeochromogenes]|uniref:hypothetical protein n=1 Tax=Streptomyces phaeochromogenes TaxID=1923 RepID=UPI0006E39C8A